MQKLFAALCCTLLSSFLFGQDTITKQFIFQVGYVSEYVDGGGAGLNGFEGQAKILFKKQRLASGEKLGEGLYFNVGYTVFPGSAYTLNQLNAGIGFTTPFLIKALHMDIGVGAAQYSGTLGDEQWAGKKVDFGGHFGLTLPLGRNGALYSKLWVPGGFSMLSDDKYIAPVFIVAGVQF